ncbi:MAG: glycosyltransferase family 4 protein [Nanoarchaeota archaeon]|nr:glycosyltransferase family 4 protein [Nanoarchaeota archaeon]MBU1855245.1 glycosyltransferase family 4 protein [Nanoarchaeota archaeon]
MRVLMLGWEFPPIYSGGLGTACFGLTKGLSHHNVHVTFVMPTGPSNVKGEYVNLMVADKIYKNKKITIRKVQSILVPYLTSQAYDQELSLLMKKDEGSKTLYGRDLFDEVYKYSQRIKLLASTEEFDIIHAHDWMTYQAGIKAKEISGKPLVLHIHATEFDRTGGHNLNQYVYDIERMGFHKADRILAVSNYTKNMVVRHYGVSPDKVEVVHNAVEFKESPDYKINTTDKLVLFLGRITLQKGPDYFLEAAKKVFDMDPSIKFMFAGSGDMEPRMIERAAELGISNNVLFAGFLKGEDVNRAYHMADVYVMPSVSEPFGITPLEAMKSGTPVIISRQSGVSEVISHVLKVDFWDVEDIANKILAVVHYRTLNNELKHHGSLEVKKFSWDIPAEKCLKVYQELIR